MAHNIKAGRGRAPRGRPWPARTAGSARRCKKSVIFRTSNGRYSGWPARLTVNKERSGQGSAGVPSLPAGSSCASDTSAC